MTRSPAAIFVGAMLAATFTRGNPPALYTEKYRPQFHFTSSTDWLNDPNGLVYYDGEYHLFFQRAPGSTDGNTDRKSWGHAISTDLVHWTQLPDAISPDANGSIWSGSAVVDWHNTSGFGKDGKPPLVAFYTNAKTPFDQRLAYSTDRGRTWTKYATPILANIHGQNRDPKVIWHEPTKRWVMALYLDEPNHYALFTSSDLKTWGKLQDVTLEGDNECPDFFPLALDGDATTTKWIFTGASARYVVGTFDGKAFTPETDSLVGEHGPNFYAAQTFSDEPTGRRIQIGWMRDGQYPGMPFNQQMSFPCELTLHSTPRGPRLFRWPVKEIDSLHTGRRLPQHDNVLQTWNPHPPQLISGNDVWSVTSCELADVDLTILPDPDVKGTVTVNIHGMPITYRTETRTTGALTCWDRRMPIELHNGRFELRALTDRTSIELFVNRGEMTLSGCVASANDDCSLHLSASGGSAGTGEATIHELRSALPATAPTTQP